MISYKHAASVTGQVFFCAAPIRLDAYDGCQFGCVYCFSRKRARAFASDGIHAASPVALQKRLERIAAGELASALDEFLQARVPIQLGGLHDPFTPRERDLGVTLALLKILKDYDQPTLISTKGDLLLEEHYLSVLAGMNVLVRFSASGVREAFRAGVDRRCGTFARTLEKIATLSKRGVATALRIQPVIPGFEDDALEMTRRAAEAGAKQVSFEYLKLAKETAKNDARILKNATGIDVFEHMRSLGLIVLGWDFTLSRDAKRPFVREARKVCHRLGLRFGAGDTEFIPWSDGDGCCGSSSAFLRGARQFEANFSGAIMSALGSKSKRVTFDRIRRAWAPSRPVSTYLNWRSRGVRAENTDTDWQSLVANRWNGDGGPYSPAFFDGVEWSGRTDRDGRRIYDASRLAAEVAG